MRRLQINFNFSNRAIYTLGIIGVLIVGGWAVFAWQSGGPASTFGHSVDELDFSTLGFLKLGTGSGLSVGPTEYDTINLIHNAVPGSASDWEQVRDGYVTAISLTNTRDDILDGSISFYTTASPGFAGDSHTGSDFTPKMLITPDGKVGIGTGRTTSPTQKLEVAGNIQASGTICDGSGNCVGSGTLDIIQRTCTATAHHDASCTANCPAGYTVIAGGCSCSSQWWKVVATRPSGTTGWYCRGHEDYGSLFYDKTITGYAICVR